MALQTKVILRISMGQQAAVKKADAGYNWSKYRN
jgi:hypothetical protein